MTASSLLLRLRLVGLALLFCVPITSAAEPVRVFAAVSMKEVLEQIAGHHKARGGEQVRLAFAGSGTLAKQIENGAPADIFVSANTAWMDYLQERGLLVPHTRRNIAANELVLVVGATEPAGRFPTIAPGFALADALGQDRIALAHTGSVPAGIYARQALVALGVWDELAIKRAETDNVRAALRLVLMRAVPAGIVYRTDAMSEPGVRIVGAFEAKLHDPIVYQIAAVRPQAGNVDRSQSVAAFLDLFRSPHVVSILQNAGFARPGSNGAGQ